MKNIKKRTSILSAGVITLMLASCVFSSKNEKIKPTVETSSNEVKIGNQVWMVQNLSTDKFRNGDPIPRADSEYDWLMASKNKQPAWCPVYFIDSADVKKYGNLYNWFAVTDPRGLAPEGWHVPSKEEWSELEQHLGKINAGVVMKNDSGWNVCEKGSGNGTNASGFSALPGFARYVPFPLEGFGDKGCFWSSTEIDALDAYGLTIFNHKTTVRIEDYIKGLGLSVRCLRDN